MNIQPIALDKSQAAIFVALSETSIDRLKDFPKPRQVSPRRVAYLVSELTEWMHSRPVSSILPPENTGYGRAGKPKAVIPDAH